MSRKNNRIWAQQDEAIVILANNGQDLNVNHAGVQLTASLFNMKPETVIELATARRPVAAEVEAPVVETLALVDAIDFLVDAQLTAEDLAAQVDARLAQGE